MSGIRSAFVASARVGRVGGIQWSAEGPREETGHDAAIGGVLVEPRMLAFGHHQRLDGG